MMNYMGTSKMETTNKNHVEIIPEKPENWNVGYRFYQFSFINYDPCRVRINGGQPIYLHSEQGFDIKLPYNSKDRIHSFVIEDSNVRYTWIGVY